jgi:hypothetical protein
MKQEYLGTESITDEDRGYNECFAEVRDALFANPYQEGVTGTVGLLDINKPRGDVMLDHV